MPGMKQQIIPLFARGAEWRRWDLHVHTPASTLANEFKSWESYEAALDAAGSTVAVLGSTDYCSIDGYKQLLALRGQGRLANFSLILPNIEFRIQTETKDGRAINLHLLVSPDDPQHVAEIEQALSRLTFTYGKKPYSCTREGLTTLGAAHDPQQKNADALFRHGVNNFKPSFDTFRDWYQTEGWLNANSLVALANAGTDGASGLSKDSGFAALRDELYRFSHIIFSAKPKDRLYFVGEGSDTKEEVVRKCGSLKPCAHGSDAHTEERLFKPDLNRYCWIKADPTFEGLRQILHEPADRIHIGETAPHAIDDSKVIARVSFSDAEHWFAKDEIPLNSGLIAIIGEKGSGKTALAELIATAAGARGIEKSPSSFITKAGDLLEGVTTTLTWVDRKALSFRAGDEPSEELPKVRYLSQDFVEELCSRDISGRRLVEEIEQVVFSYIDAPDRLNTTTFADLRRIKIEDLTSKRADIRARISRLNIDIVRLEDELATKPEKLRLNAKLVADADAIMQQLPALSEAADQAVGTQLYAEQDALRKTQSDLAELNRRLAGIRTARARLATLEAAIDDHFSELSSTLASVGLSDVEIERFRPQFPDNYIEPLDRLERELKATSEQLRGNPDAVDPLGATIADIQARIAGLEGKLSADEKQRERLLALRKQHEALRGDAERTMKEIRRLDGAVFKELDAKKEQRWVTYLSYFQTLAEECDQLSTLYAPLKKVIAQDPTGAITGFQLDVRQTVDHQSWLATGLSLFDRRKKKDLPFLDEQEFLEGYRKTLLSSWQTAETKHIKDALAGLIDAIGKTTGDMDAKLTSRSTRLQLYDWLFSTAHISMEYGLTYQNVPLEALSPGTRGVVLLVLYLAMDQHDVRPVIIDQPEGNLDNSSVYDSLVPFLRRAKKKRQMILVTHNPNLVVAADADQVIVATATKDATAKHPKITYTCGSLEQVGDLTSIREQAVRLLEGGKAPFKLRDKRWAIAPADSFSS